MKFQIIERKISIKNKTYYTFLLYCNNQVFSRLGYFIPLKNYIYVSINLKKLYFLIVNYGSQLYIQNKVYKKIFLIYYYYLKILNNNNKLNNK